MSGPGGSTTKRDQRRESRRQQFEQRRVEREKARKRALRNQRIKQASFGVGAILIIAIIAFLAIGSGGSASTTTMKLASNGHPATGQPVDSLPCGQETVQVHYHEYIEVYANGKQVNLPSGIGIVSPSGDPNGGYTSNGSTVCFYPLHVHPNDQNVVHIESPANVQYYLGQFFDIFGQPLSATKVAGYTADASHKLVFETIPENGTPIVYTGDPTKLPFDQTGHETIVILYNSPNVHPKAFTNWLNGE
ncbi:MAG: hypothetical protein ACRDHE_03885 [Ktedonobacterales bacterium]